VGLITNEVSAALGRALQAIDSCDMRYALVGGLAVSAWALPRATRDADLWVELGAKRPALEVALGDVDFHVPAMEEELNRFGVFRSKDKATGVFVDIFDAVGPLGEAILEHRVQGQLASVAVWLARADELAVLKVYSDRRRDFDDLVALIKHADISVDYLRQWAKELDGSIGSDEVSARLAGALRDAEGKASTR
jgi:hypothetical protein